MSTNEHLEQIVLIPTEILQLIPLFGGDKRQLNLIIRQCEYVINKYVGGPTQNMYVMHSIMSRLKDNAAALISEREDITTWDEFKELLTLHFGDPRSEECIAIELESMKIRQGESYLEFCNRVQSVRSVLISKVNLITDSNLKQSKIIIYNNTSLNVFLYNLPENVVSVVRLKSPRSLEEALSVVMEEVNFYDQYTARLTPFEVVFGHTDSNQIFSADFDKAYTQQILKDHAKRTKYLYQYLTSKMLEQMEKVQSDNTDLGSPKPGPSSSKD
ncbi:uncharacterized protein LOC124542504 [Vanessa cardui]|uniref:uncharacterized protein LOC124542504 n=1 Tax=Vanessa cardui TaxID=171605 RepID=UPI001F13E25C|nr:uncharacterized protein LOC124542504 [Vanessa cardui]